jgi:hypothetical protein|tara:strand:- start:419 stop:655 length:237 start_codon:yes stop_codon:yes gene_type:complete
MTYYKKDPNPNNLTTREYIVRYKEYAEVKKITLQLAVATALEDATKLLSAYTLTSIIYKDYKSHVGIVYSRHGPECWR